MAAAELRLVLAGLGVEPLDGIERRTDGRSLLLRFSIGDDGGIDVPAVLGQLCAAAALFRHHPAGGVSADGALLEPLTLHEPLAYGSELVTTQRYRGKTNERLTRAMLNAALATAGVDPAEPTGTLLDPMCGRGTSLNWALAYGLDAIGVELDGAALVHHASFLQTWAKRQRLPHKHQRHRTGNAEHRVLTFEVAPDRTALKAGRGQRVQTFSADAGDRGLAIRNGAADVIVVDLPYGVQHRGSGAEGGGRSERGAGGADADAGEGGGETIELLRRVLPAWHRWVRPGGALSVAWNVKRAPRRAVTRELVEAGFSPVTVTGGYSMRHTVDATIDRDVVTARR